MTDPTPNDMHPGATSSAGSTTSEPTHSGAGTSSCDRSLPRAVPGGETDRSLLSDKDIPAKDRLIVALDVPSAEEALEAVDLLGDAVTFYKVGLELFMGSNYFDLVRELKVRRGKRVFVDLKFFDVPQTVAAAVRQLSKHKADFATVHGNQAMIEAAVAAGGETAILAVTMLTSFDQDDASDLGFGDVPIEEIVASRARRAVEAGAAGVISSGLEVGRLRRQLGDKFLVVVPGIRPFVNRVTDDQKRTVDVEEAFLSGADHIVVGRPVLGAENPRDMAESVQERIADLFGT